MLKKILLVITFMCLASTAVFTQTGQNAYNDSIQNQFIKHIQALNHKLHNQQDIANEIAFIKQNRSFLQSQTVDDTLIVLFKKALQLSDSLAVDMQKYKVVLQSVMAGIYQVKGDLAQAERLYADIYQNFDGQKQPNFDYVLDAAQNVCLIKKRKNDSDVYKSFQECLQIHQKYNARKKLASFLVQFGNLLLKDKPLMTFEMAEYAEDIYKAPGAGKFHEELVDVYALKGFTRLMAGDLQASLDYYHKALQYVDMAERIPAERMARLYKDIARIHLFMNNADSGAYYVDKLKKQLIKQSAPSNSQLRALYSFKSRVFHKQQQLDSALHYRKKTIAIDSVYFPRNSHRMKTNYYALSTIYGSMQQYKKAIKVIHENLRYEYPEPFGTGSIRDLPPKKLFPQVNVNAILQDLMQKVFCQGELYRKTQDIQWLKEVRAHYFVVDFYVKALQESVVEKNFLEVVQLNRKGYQVAANTLKKLYRKTDNKKYLKEEYYFRTALKGRLLAYQNYQLQMANRGKTEVEQAHSDIYKEINELKARKSAVSKLEEKETINDSLFKLYVTHSFIKRELEQGKQTAQQFNMSRYHASADTLMKQIPENTAYVEYILEKDSLRIFTFLKNKMFSYTVEAGKQFHNEISEFRKSIKTGSNYTNSKLYNYLIGPVEKHIQHKPHWVIIPDDKIFDIPFEAIQIPEKDELLINQFNISYHYSGYFWLKSQNNTRMPDRPSIALYAPVFNSNKSADISSLNTYRDAKILSKEEIVSKEGILQALPYSQKEVHSIAKKFRAHNMQTTIFTKKKAVEHQFRAYTSADIIHVATHGVSNEQTPEKSGLFFSQVRTKNHINDYKNDGFVHMNELYEMEFDADLTVLSACKSGTGKIFSGEGFFGLPRGFILAGTNNLIVSLWKLHDQKTAELINYFYDHLLTGANYAQALRKAKLDMIEQDVLPIDWSGIILIGR